MNHSNSCLITTAVISVLDTITTIIKPFIVVYGHYTFFGQIEMLLSGNLVSFNIQVSN